MAKIFKSVNGDVIISITKEENKTLINALQKGVEELRLMQKGEAMTNVDQSYAEEALEGLLILHDVYSPDDTVADIAKRYATPAVYHRGSKEFEELENMPMPLWDAFLDELASYGLTCSYNNQHDTFTIG